MNPFDGEFISLQKEKEEEKEEERKKLIQKQVDALLIQNTRRVQESKSVDL